MTELDDFRVFRTVSAANGFRAAARQLNATTAGVSNSIKRLEDRLGVRLFTRTTRRVALTTEGRQLLDRIEPLLDGMALAESEIRDRAGATGGVVRISAPVIYAVHCLTAPLAALREQYPDIEIELILDDDVVNLVSAEIDIAIRIGELHENGLIARRLGTTRWCIIASPAYLAEHGTPDTLEDMRHHSCITYLKRGTRLPWLWRFLDRGKVREWLPPRGIVIDDGSANRAFALAGAGVVFDLSFAFEADLVTGTVIELFPHSSIAGPPISLVWQEGAYLPARVRTVIDHLTKSVLSQDM
jgi:LysR family transcriptional regulator, regulator for bpeEF and oprC